MKLTNEDKELLKRWGHKDEDLAQIERATTKTTYIINGNKITTDEVINILGREKYLTGISRSAFHYTASRQDEKGNNVHFDSSKLFKI